MSEEPSLHEQTGKVIAIEDVEETTPVPEEPAIEPVEAEFPTLEVLTEELARARQQAEQNRDAMLRTQAEMENLRRRTDKDIQDARKFALERFARDLLAVLDSLELGIQAAGGDSPEVAKLREGSELTLKQFLSVLEKFNVVPVEALGQKFNPELHQAMAMEPTAEAEPNTVVKVFQKGYTLNDRLLRPAMVVIAQALPQQT
ncbi:MAG: nucleotide exchange factor GrpE [Methylococcaceae bacterium]|nr:nucleotide exchange factor GrpE [Methylococcaceae bacterium]